MKELRDRVAALSLEKRSVLETRLQSSKFRVAQNRIPRREHPEMPVVLSFGQERLWFLNQLDSGNSFYNLSLATRFSSPIQARKLEESINEIVRRHEALRTRFAMINEQPVQIVAPHVYVHLEVIDLTGKPESEREDEGARLSMIEAQRPFDLERDLLFRATLLRLAQSEYVLLMTMHHIVSDGWSMSILYRELSAMYSAKTAGQSARLLTLPIQYADFALWQRGFLQGEVLEKLLSYWKTKLANLPPILELPTDRPRPKMQVFQGAVYALGFPKSLLDGLKVIARKTDTTLFMILLAAFKVLLFRYSGQADVIVGTPIANRTRREIEGLIGFFVNTLVLRTDLSNNPTFDELVSCVRETTLEAFVHQDLPFEKLVEELQPERNLSHNPIFQVMFVLQNNESPSQTGAAPSSPQSFAGTSKFDLTLCTTEMLDGLMVAFEYNTNLFDKSTIVAMTRHFQTILENATAQPERRVSDLLLSGAAERGCLLAECSGPSFEIRLGRIPEPWEVQAHLRPGAPAISFQEQRLTYQEVNARANQLARALRDRGVGPEVMVGLGLERSPQMVIALLAILKAGGAYVPLDPAYPRDRLAYMVEDSGMTMLLTETPLLATLPSHKKDVFCLDTEWPHITAYADHDLAPLTTPDNLAYMIYTSGSTGRPKGVMVAHRGLCNLLDVQINTFGLTPESRILQFASLCFDAAMFEILLAAGAGATLCLAPRAAILPGSPLVELLRDHKISVAVIPPSALAVLPEVAFPDLKVMVVAGEACPLELVTRWSPGRRFFNGYGPTEASICSTIAACEDALAAPPIGRAISNTQAYILDENLAPVPDGAPGEIYLGGVGLARGYHGRPELTAERFLPDLFSGQAGARLYRTGDRARRLTSGDIQYLGRIDQQVKIRGYRIELGEIEASLLEHPAIWEAAVVPQRSPSGELRLVAYFVPVPQQSVQTGQLRSYLRERLPDFMLPAAFMCLSALPLNANGKLDRQALPVVIETGAEANHGEVAVAQSEAEKRLARIWCEVLERGQVGIHDNFFELGGHSLLATRVMSRINSEFLVDLPLRRLFELPTIAEFAKQLQAASTDAAIQHKPAIVRLPRRLHDVPVY